MQEYEQTIHIEDPALEPMRRDANAVLKDLLRKMIDKDRLEGKLTISLDVTLKKEMVRNNDPSIEGDQRPSYIPMFSHKVGSVMQLKEELKGDAKYDDMELVWDETMKDFIMRPATGKDQMTVLDAEFREVDSDDPEETKGIAGPTVPLIEQNPPIPLPFSDYDGPEDMDYEEPEG